MLLADGKGSLPSLTGSFSSMIGRGSIQARGDSTPAARLARPRQLRLSNTGVGWRFGSGVSVSVGVGAV